MRPDDLKEFSAFLQQIRMESDRGLALVGAAFIDEKLSETLAAFFLAEASASDILIGKNAPLGGFAARIETSFALGLIEDIERHDCDYIRKVRNEFAHKVVGSSFEHGRIPDLCSNFKSEMPEPEIPKTPTPRFRFENTVITMASRLFYRPEYVKRDRRTARVWVDPETIRWRKTSEELPPDGMPVIGVHVR